LSIIDGTTCQRVSLLQKSPTTDEALTLDSPDTMQVTKITYRFEFSLPETAFIIMAGLIILALIRSEDQKRESKERNRE